MMPNLKNNIKTLREKPYASLSKYKNIDIATLSGRIHDKISKFHHFAGIFFWTPYSNFWPATPSPHLQGSYGGTKRIHWFIPCRNSNGQLIEIPSHFFHHCKWGRGGIFSHNFSLRHHEEKLMSKFQNSIIL